MCADWRYNPGIAFNSQALLPTCLEDQYLILSDDLSNYIVFIADCGPLTSSLVQILFFLGGGGGGTPAYTIMYATGYHIICYTIFIIIVNYSSLYGIQLIVP